MQVMRCPAAACRPGQLSWHFAFRWPALLRPCVYRLAIRSARIHTPHSGHGALTPAAAGSSFKVGSRAMAPGKRSSYEFEDADEHDALSRAGAALKSPPKGKDALLRVLKVRWGPTSGCLAFAEYSGLIRLAPPAAGRRREPGRGAADLGGRQARLPRPSQGPGAPRVPAAQGQGAPGCWRRAGRRRVRWGGGSRPNHRIPVKNFRPPLEKITKGKPPSTYGRKS